VKLSVCGKGGSGKSVLSVVLAYEIQRRGYDVIVIDSDESNSSLFRLLGLEYPPQPLTELAGGRKQIFEMFPKNQLGGSGAKTNVLSHDHILIDEIPPEHIVKRNGIRLLSVGKILQPLEGCACPMGVLSREFLKNLQLLHNQVVIVDTEAGVEHFGRGVEASVDQILVVVEPSYESLIIADKISTMVGELGKNRPLIVINKAPTEQISRHIVDNLKKKNLTTVGCIPYDLEIFEACLEGQSLEGKKLPELIPIADTLLQSKAPMDTERR